MNGPTTLCSLLMFGSLCCGCIKEDLSGCPTGLTVEMSYTGDGSTQIFPEKIRDVTVYLFDDERTCIANRRATPDELASRTLSFGDLDAGGRIICLGNAFHTQVSDRTVRNYEDILFADRAWFDGERIASNDSLYYASLYLDPGRETADYRLDFSSAHYKVYVEVTGFDPSAWTPAGSPSLEMCGLMPCTDFENRVGGECTNYYPALTPEEGDESTLAARFNIMRHPECQDVSLRLLDAEGGEIASVDIEKFIALHPEIALEKHEVTIPVSFRFKDSSVEIVLPEWFVHDITPEL